jgi:NAD(P)-dependent dehydrogenase (short-subunit alcohol dehydrogenase family)
MATPRTASAKRSPRRLEAALPGSGLEGRTAIVTGSGRNIGKAIALQLARAGANVVVNGHRDRRALDGVVAEIESTGGNAIAVIADVGDHRQVEKMVRTAEREFGQVDIAVSNAALRLRVPFLEMSVDDWHRTLNINLDSAFYIARAVLAGMKERRWGRLIHISGEDGFAAHVDRRAHTIVSKAGIHAFAKAIAQEFGPYGITSNTVSPGPTDTLRDWKQYPPGWAKKRVAPIPLKRVASVDDIAAACLYLAGTSGAYITGQVIHVNGGLFMY